MPRSWVQNLCLFIVAVACVLAGLLFARPAPADPLPVAPPIPAGLQWYNVSRPLTLKALRGRAVLLDFFSPGCINCIHMLPLEAQLEKRFGPRLVVIGVDSPKFSSSSSPAAVESFIARHRLSHPVVLDHHSQLWNRYGVNAWPTLVLIGPRGRVVDGFIGDDYSVAQLAKPIAKSLHGAPAAATLAALPLSRTSQACTFLSMPAGLAVAPQYVAIADTGHNRIVLARHNGTVVAIVRGDSAIPLKQPHGLAFHDGALYVADTGDNRVDRIDLKTLKLSVIAGNGKRAFLNEGPYPATKATLNSPWGLAWHDDQLYVSMSGDHQIWRYDPKTKRIGQWAGTGEEGLRDGRLYNAAFAQPSGLAVHDGVLYDADPESSTVRAIDLHPSAPDSQMVQTLAGPDSGLFNFGLKNGPARRALFQHPEALAYANGTLYVADTFNNAIRGLDLKTAEVGTVARNIPRPLAIATLSHDTLLVAAGDDIRLLQTRSGRLLPWPVTHTQASRCKPVER